MKPRLAEFLFNSEKERQPIPIIADGAIASRFIGDGRLIPLLICDTTERPDLAEHIRVHQLLPPGDVRIQWAGLTDLANKVALVLSFTRPTEFNAILEFDIAEQGILVDQILNSGGLYLQAGRPGDRVRTTHDAPKIIIEVADTGFKPTWGEMWLKRMVKEARRQGASRKDAQKAARQYVDRLREIGHLRMRGSAGAKVEAQ